MSKPTLSQSGKSCGAAAESSTSPEALNEELLTLKALRLMLESRLINPSDYARRLESIQKRSRTEP